MTRFKHFISFLFKGRVPFAVPRVVLWDDVATMLSMKFNHLVGRHLNPDAIEFLKNKLPTGLNTDGQTIVTWTNFAKVNLPEHKFAFWDWFYAIMKLCSQHLSNHWKDGAIAGFIDKDASERILSKCSPGTFLVRFSDSRLGGISIVFAKRSENIFNNSIQFEHIEPWEASDFKITALADRVRDLLYLTHLWTPTGVVPKDEKFGQYYTPIISKSSKGPPYVP